MSACVEPVFLEQAYDGACSRIEVLEDRLRILHRLVLLAAAGHYDTQWVRAAFDSLASMPSDPTLME